MDIGKIFTNLRIHRRKKRIIVLNVEFQTLIKDLYDQCFEE